MRILSLHLHHFGAITNERLDFQDGLTVVTGANEAGKSTWHAAATLLLTGFPKSLRNRSIKPLYERYQPWSGSEYKISGVVELDDGRRLRIVRDFAARTSQIHEQDRGPLVSPLTTDASVDLSELVGLDRTTLPLVASVRQTEILELARSAGSKEGAALRDFLQRSLASRAESDMTAESAIEAIERFRRAHIGSNKQGSNKPMRRALEAVHAAEAAYERGVTQWEQYHEREQELAADIAYSRQLGQELAAARHSSRRAERERLITRIDEVASIDARLRDGIAAGTVPSDDLFDQARQLWARRSVFEERPDDTTALRHKREQIRAEIETLPTTIESGLETVPDAIRSARADYEEACRYLALVERDRPVTGDHEVLDVDPNLIRSVADELGRPVLSVDSNLRARRDELARQADVDRRRSSRTVLVGAILLVVAVGCVALGSIAALGVGFVLLGSAAITMWRSLQIRQRVGLQLSKLADLDRRIMVESDRAEAGRVRRLELEEIVSRWGCRPTPGSLRHAADRVDEARAAHARVVSWQERRALAQRRCGDAGDTLAAALATAGYPAQVTAGGPAQVTAGGPAQVTAGGPAQVTAGGPAQVTARDSGPGDMKALLAAAERLERDVKQHRRDKEALTRRRDLVSQCVLLDQALESAERAERRIDAYVGTLESFLATVGLDAADRSIDAQLSLLEGWLGKSRQIRTRWEADERLRARRDALCADGEFDAMKSRLHDLDVELAATEPDGTGAPRQERSPRAGAPRSERDAEELEAEYRVVQARIDRSRGALSELAGQLTALTELAEQRAKARHSRDRLVEQEELLACAQQHLNAARSRVHSAIAPQLVQATADRLAVVTAGRYKRLEIDPDDLSVHVEVESGAWHDARSLSFGTVEQIYLLLRAAIAEIVAPDAETCPLLLDDATVHADSERTEAMVAVLAELGRERQVIVFSQERVVCTAGSSGGATIIDLAA